MSIPYRLSIIYQLIQILSILILVKTECIDVSNPKTRTFTSLSRFQSNKIAFDPTNKKSEGNYVVFTNLLTDILRKNSFIAYDSNHIAKLSLENQQITQIEDGTFESLSCVMQLDLCQNKLEAISKNTFIGLPFVHKLDLGMNHLKELPNYTFNFTRRLKILNVTRNNLKVLYPDSFYKLFLLEELDLSYNYIDKIVPEMFQYFKALSNLQIGSNQIEYLNLEKWKNLPNLKVLNLSNNALISIDLSYEFSFGSTLTELYINKNYLTKINNFGLKNYLPAIKVIDINDNPWVCDVLAPVIKTLNDLRITYKHLVDTEPNVGGIACNRSIDFYKNDKWMPPTTEAQTKYDPPISLNTSTYLNFGNESTDTKILNAITSLQSISLCFFVVIILYVFIDLSLRHGCFKNLFGQRRFVGSDVEDISLLRSGV